MPHAHVLERVRATVKSFFASHGAASLDDFCEAILVREGFYCGRQFTCAGMRGVWFIEENRLKFFDRDNRLIQSQSANELDEGRVSAA